MQTETIRTETPAPFDLTAPCAVPDCLGTTHGDLPLCKPCWGAAPSRLRARWVVTRAILCDAVKARETTTTYLWSGRLLRAQRALVASLAPATDAPVEAAA